ncbi:MAG: acyltransferase [Tannerellaceae bacterium]|jgi:acetyltransferase-like isoleucine patch superfamily enzyme|nr:acyltransferase [Tannerellaceae bacterium]
MTKVYQYANRISSIINWVRFRKNKVHANCLFNSLKINGSNNVVKTGSIRHCKISITGNNNMIYIGEYGHINKCEFCISSSNSSIHIGVHNTILNSLFSVLDDFSTIRLGKDGYVGGARFFSIGKNNQIVIGDNFLFSDNIDLWNGDGHPIIDNTSMNRINEDKPIQIHDNVWIGTGSIILKGVNISENSIIGSKSLVTNDVPANTLVAGNPAKPIKNNISWKRERN